MLLFGINLFSKNSKNNFIEDYFMLILARCLKIFSILLKEWTTSYSQKIFLWVIASNLSIIGNNYSVLIITTLCINICMIFIVCDTFKIFIKLKYT